MIRAKKNFTEEKIKSPNNSLRGGFVPDMICCSQRYSRISDCVAANRKENDRAVHYAVGSDGRIYNFGDIKYAVRNASTDRDAKAVSLSRLIKERGVPPELYTVYVDFERKKSGELTEKAYMAGLELMKYIIALCRKRYGVEFPIDRDHIIGRYEYCPVSDAYSPGLDFPLSELVADLKAMDGENK